MNISGFTINDVLWNGLRGCQQGSVQTALSYVRRPFNEETKSCLISLPTGAGKSGVITVICHKATQRKVLVLCHSRAVCDQLFDDTSINGIYVSTFQKLQTFNMV